MGSTEAVLKSVYSVVKRDGKTWWTRVGKSFTYRGRRVVTLFVEPTGQLVEHGEYHAPYEGPNVLRQIVYTVAE